MSVVDAMMRLTRGPPHVCGLIHCIKPHTCGGPLVSHSAHALDMTHVRPPPCPPSPVLVHTKGLDYGPGPWCDLLRL